MIPYNDSVPSDSLNTLLKYMLYFYRNIAYALLLYHDT